MIDNFKILQIWTQIQFNQTKKKFFAHHIKNNENQINNINDTMVNSESRFHNDRFDKFDASI